MRAPDHRAIFFAIVFACKDTDWKVDGGSIEFALLRLSRLIGTHGQWLLRPRAVAFSPS